MMLKVVSRGQKYTGLPFFFFAQWGAIYSVCADHLPDKMFKELCCWLMFPHFFVNEITYLRCSELFIFCSSLLWSCCTNMS